MHRVIYWTGKRWATYATSVREETAQTLATLLRDEMKFVEVIQACSPLPTANPNHR